MIDSYYNILGVSKNVTQDELLQKYNECVSYWHPYHFLDSSDALINSTNRFKQIQNAYFVLSDPTLRWSYDQELYKIERQLTRKSYPQNFINTFKNLAPWLVSTSLWILVTIIVFLGQVDNLNIIHSITGLIFLIVSISVCWYSYSLWLKHLDDDHGCVLLFISPIAAYSLVKYYENVPYHGFYLIVLSSVIIFVIGIINFGYHGVTFGPNIIGAITISAIVPITLGVKVEALPSPMIISLVIGLILSGIFIEILLADEDYYPENKFEFFSYCLLVIFFVLAVCLPISFIALIKGNDFDTTLKLIFSGAFNNTLKVIISTATVGSITMFFGSISSIIIGSYINRSTENRIASFILFLFLLLIVPLLLYTALSEDGNNYYPLNNWSWIISLLVLGIFFAYILLWLILYILLIILKVLKELFVYLLIIFFVVITALFPKKLIKWLERLFKNPDD
jgi:hypothetical protein